MIYFERSQPEPDSLQIERSKINGSYSSTDVLERLKSDFKDKCYICETKNPTSINVEHLIPHRGDKSLKFKWDNLFWSCAHCNNIKLAKYDNILDCTNAEEKVEESIKLKIDPYPLTEIEVIPLRNDEKVDDTVELLKKVYNGNTALKTIESEYIRDLLLKEILQFCNYLSELISSQTTTKKQYYYMLVKESLDSSSPFASFKRWIVKDTPRLKEKLEEFSMINN
ncbi:HNH endonuclease [Lysinibacillus fusiformis]|uniref:HNH endonuclease n=1 Tax=Lysinibacillus fusiformis TaxID=28031 RepID=UPI0023A9646C|nr:hypothetical protein [Lysinibacillus fusiformis]WEA38042.1 hypothetical protein PWJ66_15365 [Lysinibacillus fusiformis]